MHVSKAKQRINSLLPIGRQVFSHLQESRAPSRVTVTWEDKHHHSERPPIPSSSPSFLLLSMTSYGMGYPFGQLGSAVPAVSPPNLLPTPSLLTGRAEQQKEKASMLRRHCSATAKTRGCCQHCSGQQIQNTGPYGLL